MEAWFRMNRCYQRRRRQLAIFSATTLAATAYRQQVMRIAIEANVLTSKPPTGIARYIRRLSVALDALNRPGGEVIETELLYRWTRYSYRRLIEETSTQRRALRVGDLWPRPSRYDCVLCTFRKTLNWPQVPRIATVYDFYQEIGLGHGAKEDQQFLEERRRLLANATRIICISEATRNDLIRLYPETGHRAVAIHLGVEDRFSPASGEVVSRFRSRYALDRPFVVFLGLNSPNKNLARLVEAYRISAIRRDFDLVIAGPAGVVDGRGAQLAPDSGSGIRTIGFIPDDDLPALYSAASALVMPSLYEGFGLPILEAMRCGTPVLAGNRGASPEVASGHATLVDPLDVAAIATGMLWAVDTPLDRRMAAEQYARTKSWSKTAEQTLEVIREAISLYAYRSGSAGGAAASSRPH